MKPESEFGLGGLRPEATWNEKEPVTSEVNPLDTFKTWVKVE
jgi:hypothetical protein